MSTIEHLVFLTNTDGVRAKVATLLVQGSTLSKVIALAKAKNFMNFVVYEEVDSQDGYSSQMVAGVVNGVVVSGRLATV